MQEGKALSIQMDKIFGEFQRCILEWKMIGRQIFQSGSRLAWHQFKKKTINIVKQLNKSEQQDEISQDEPEQRAAEEEENIENQENEEGILQDQNQRENEISNSLLTHQSQLQQQQADQTQSKCMHFQLDAQDMNLNLNQSLIRNIQDSSISHYQENIRAEVNLDGCVDNSYEGPELQSQSINQQNNQSGVSRQQNMNYDSNSKKLKTQKRPLQNIIVTRQQEKQKQQEKCDYHNLKVWYDCTNDKKKGKKHCNKCLTDSKDHFRHNVICKVHRGPLKMAIIKEEQNLQEETQKFYCEKCSKNQMQTYKAICQKHFRLIKYVCFDKKCIDTKQFSICELCEHNHEHLLTNFQEDQLQQKVKCRKELHQKQIQKYLDKIKQKLHMRIFFKPFSIRSKINYSSI